MKIHPLLHKIIPSIVTLSWCYVLSANAAEISRHHQTVSGQPGWLINDGAVEIQLNPLQADQVRAFYLARGFSNEVTQQIESNCVFQLVISNVSKHVDGISIDVDLSQWQITTPGGNFALTDKVDWLQRWKNMGASEASLVAFRWATFPWEQTYVQSGDYGWGMILLGNPTKALPDTFSLMLRWTVAGLLQSQQIEGLSCPE